MNIISRLMETPMVAVLRLCAAVAGPVNIGGIFFEVSVTLDPANLSKDTGTLSASLVETRILAASLRSALRLGRPQSTLRGRVFP